MSATIDQRDTTSTVSTIDYEPRQAPRTSIGGYVLAIVIFVVVLLVLIALLIYYIVVKGKGSTSTTGGLGQPCNSDGSCTSPLVCDTSATPQACKSDVGSTCSQDSDCVTGSTCSGGTCLSSFGQTCQSSTTCAPPGTCNSSSICSTTGQSCSSSAACLMPGLTSSQVQCGPVTGPACTKPSDCPSPTTCTNGFCTGSFCGLTATQPCNTAVDCLATEVCDPRTPAMTPSQCRLLPQQSCTNGDQCQVGASCNSGSCSFVPCTTAASCLAGQFCAGDICVPITCTSDDECVNAYGLGSGWMCVQGSGATSTCVSNGYDCPHDCTQSQQSCAGSICQNKTGQPCRSDVECASQFCNLTLSTPTCQAAPS
jgi:hypothetical protein